MRGNEHAGDLFDGPEHRLECAATPCDRVLHLGRSGGTYRALYGVLALELAQLARQDLPRYAIEVAPKFGESLRLFKQMPHDLGHPCPRDDRKIRVRGQCLHFGSGTA